MTRRVVIRQTVIAATAFCVPGPTLRWSSKGQQAQGTIGLLMGTVEPEMIKDPEGTLAKIRSFGYQSLEYPDTFGLPIDRLTQLIQRNKLISLAGGNSMWAFMKNLPQLIEQNKLLGKQYLICYWPWPDDGRNKTIADWRAISNTFNQMGEQCKKAGIRLAYHNHDIEFAATEDLTPYDVVLQHTDPEFVTFQMDIWWIAKAGHNPLVYIEKYPGRFELCHIKTAELLANDPKAIKVDYKQVFGQAKKAGFKHYILENEKGIQNPLVFVQKSFDYIKSLLP